eukprot:GHVT01056098.1.p1 GENE.GHVT01056098.1~~GHVT01056098.1.p1  ORF type:complete len:161 (-),score=34.21 GHVT01056098.1:747-1229(-)
MVSPGGATRRLAQHSTAASEHLGNTTPVCPDPQRACDSSPEAPPAPPAPPSSPQAPPATGTAGPVAHADKLAKESGRKRNAQKQSARRGAKSDRTAPTYPPQKAPAPPNPNGQCDTQKTERETFHGATGASSRQPFARIPKSGRNRGENGLSLRSGRRGP